MVTLVKRLGHRGGSKKKESVVSLVEIEGRFQSLPLHAACSYGHLKCVEKLLEWDKNGTTLEEG